MGGVGTNTWIKTLKNKIIYKEDMILQRPFILKFEQMFFWDVALY